MTFQSNGILRAISLTEASASWNGSISLVLATGDVVDNPNVMEEISRPISN